MRVRDGGLVFIYIYYSCEAVLCVYDDHQLGSDHLFTI